MHQIFTFTKNQTYKKNFNSFSTQTRESIESDFATRSGQINILLSFVIVEKRSYNLRLP